jgi:adenylate cyclase class 2
MKMTREIEAKIKVFALAPTQTRLQALGAKFMHTVRQVDTYFMDTHKLLHKKDCGLRIRQQVVDNAASAMITFKGAREAGKYKSRPEYETGIDNVQMTEHIFEALGYYKRLTVEKQRTLWQLDGCEVCLDEVVELGTFIEVEGPDEATVESVLAKLSLHHEPHIRDSYAAMVERALKLKTPDSTQYRTDE